jgi:hypothetical protein
LNNVKKIIKRIPLIILALVVAGAIVGFILQPAAVECLVLEESSLENSPSLGINTMNV